MPCACGGREGRQGGLFDRRSLALSLSRSGCARRGLGEERRPVPRWRRGGGAGLLGVARGAEGAEGRRVGGAGRPRPGVLVSAALSADGPPAGLVGVVRRGASRWWSARHCSQNGAGATSLPWTDLALLWWSRVSGVLRQQGGFRCPAATPPETRRQVIELARSGTKGHSTRRDLRDGRGDGLQLVAPGEDQSG